MGRSRYKILDERYPHFITSSIINRYNLFSEKRFCDILIDGFNFMSKERGIKLHAYVIMPNHIHFIAQGEGLSKCISSFKSFTARKIIDSLIEEGNKYWLIKLRDEKVITRTDREYKLWTEGFHPKQIFSKKVMEQKLNYIHYNPVKADLVESESEWIFSSYGDYFGSSPGSVDIELFRG